MDIKDGWVYLTTADNEFEYNIIKGKLTENNITCIGKGKNMGVIDSCILNIVLGPCIPIDVIVPSELYEEAMQIITMQISDEELEKLAMNTEQVDNNE